MSSLTSTHSKLVLPPFERGPRHDESSFRFKAKNWRLRRDDYSDDKGTHIDYYVVLNGRVLNAMRLLDEEQMEDWMDVRKIDASVISPGKVPGEVLRHWTELLIDAYLNHPGKRVNLVHRKEDFE